MLPTNHTPPLWDICRDELRLTLGQAQHAAFTNALYAGIGAARQQELFSHRKTKIQQRTRIRFWAIPRSVPTIQFLLNAGIAQQEKGKCGAYISIGTTDFPFEQRLEFAEKFAAYVANNAELFGFRKVGIQILLSPRKTKYQWSRK